MYNVWNEKYRPKTFDELVLPERIKAPLFAIAESGNIPTMLFHGSPGLGKTTAAYVIAKHIDAEVLFINASMEGNIDTIRTKVLQFASSVSMTGSKKITILDECDRMSAASQDSLKSFIEEYSANNTIIFTSNHTGRIIDALKSRCKSFDFNPLSFEKQEVVKMFLKRVFSILKTENVEFDQKIVAEFVIQRFPDLRSIVNELQSMSVSGKIDVSLLSVITDESFTDLIGLLKAKKFTSIRKWVTDHSNVEQDHIFDMLYKKSVDYINPSSLPELILLIGEYSYKSSFVPNKEINLTAFFTSVIMNQSITWK